MRELYPINDDARKYLSEISIIVERIAVCKREIEYASANLTSYGSSGIAERVSATPIKDAMELQILNSIEAQNKWYALLLKNEDDLQKKRHEAIDRIFKVKSKTSRLFLIRHYIDGKDLQDISVEFGHSDPSSVYNLHSYALRDFSEVWDLYGWE